jgi:hypothetical protein
MANTAWGQTMTHISQPMHSSGAYWSVFNSDARIMILLPNVQIRDKTMVSMTPIPNIQAMMGT